MSNSRRGILVAAAILGAPVGFVSATGTSGPTEELARRGERQDAVSGNDLFLDASGVDSNTRRGIYEIAKEIQSLGDSIQWPTRFERYDQNKDTVKEHPTSISLRGSEGDEESEFKLDPGTSRRQLKRKRAPRTRPKRRDDNGNGGKKTSKSSKNKSKSKGKSKDKSKDKSKGKSKGKKSSAKSESKSGKKEGSNGNSHDGTSSPSVSAVPTYESSRVPSAAPVGLTPLPIPPPTAPPTSRPTDFPTPGPTPSPSFAPVVGQTPAPVSPPTAAPTPVPSPVPSPAPTLPPAPGQTPGPTLDMSAVPSAMGTATAPSDGPSFSPVADMEGFVKCSSTGTLPCPDPQLPAHCDKYNPLSSFSQCFDDCYNAFCCIHDSQAPRSLSCRTEENCPLYDPCYIIWFKLHDTIGPAPYLRMEQNEAFYDVDDAWIRQQIKGAFEMQLLGHHFMDEDLPLTVDTFTNPDNWD